VEPLWEPHYFNRVYSLRPLKDPKNLFKGSYEQPVLDAMRDVESALVAYAKEQVRRQSLAQERRPGRRWLGDALQGAGRG
jgi:outer membrane protein TolC